MNAWDAVWNGITAFGNWKVLVAFLAYLVAAYAPRFLMLILFWNRPVLLGVLSLVVGSLANMTALSLFLGSTVLLLTKLGSSFTWSYAIHDFWGLFGAALVGWMLAFILRFIPIAKIIVKDPQLDALIAAIPLSLYLAYGSENLIENIIQFFVDNLGFVLLCIAFVWAARFAISLVLGGLSAIHPAFDPDATLGQYLIIIFVSMMTMIPIVSTVNLAVHGRFSSALPRDSWLKPQIEQMHLVDELTASRGMASW